MRNPQNRKKKFIFRNGYFGIMVCVTVSSLFLFGLGITRFANSGMMIYPAKGVCLEGKGYTVK